jgi:aspartate carbamoyltransferase regulatory subunit
MNEVKQIKVNAIKNGTVIDHIKAGTGLKVIDILKLKGNDVVMLGINLRSSKIGKKDILKIENRELTHDEVNSIALVAPNATLTIIKNYEVAKKESLILPQIINDLIICSNPKCITNLEQIKSRFKLTDDETETVRCDYCEKKYQVKDVKINI